MLKELLNALLYGLVLLSLLLVDYALGNGFVDMTHRVFCKIFCFVKKTLKDQSKIAQAAGAPLNLPMLLVEIVTLSLTMMILNKYKHYRNKDRIDELLKESKEALRQTNAFLEKWRLRRVPSNCSYLDEEPQVIKPLNLEVPILHMAIIDTLGTTRSQLERGDAGDSINITDSTLLSVTSFLDNDFRLSAESIPDEVGAEDSMEDPKVLEVRNRYLWDVMEEDSNPDD